MRRALLRPWVVVVVGLCAGPRCIVEAPGTREDAGPGGRSAVLSNVPPLNVPVGARLDGRIEIVSAKLVPGRALPGETVTVTTTYKVIEPLQQDYTIFVHVEDMDGKRERTNVDHQPVGGTRPTSSWKAGETVEDVFEVYVPPGANLRGMNLWIGLWHPGTDTRLKLDNPEKVRNDGRDRILLATLPVGPAGRR